ncbi:hypothetical protein KQX54_011692 [Cotesia glomerata]|uniref:Uncharacterized protein n=1 Tax=Cotesia glomerata TaxID=32391 RepID=A0AAV7J838_COTGL|nr:hypothetical protein KQX54_011692 [Cotesia glomerata]
MELTTGMNTIIFSGTGTYMNSRKSGQYMRGGGDEQREIKDVKRGLDIAKEKDETAGVTALTPEEETRLVLEESSRVRWPPFPSNHPGETPRRTPCVYSSCPCTRGWKCVGERSPRDPTRGTRRGNP